MKWTQYDKNQVTNLIIAMKKAKFEMTGMEVVAFADVFKWVSLLHDHIDAELAPKPQFVPTPDAVSKPEDHPLVVPKVEEQPKVKLKKEKKKND